MFKKLAFTKIEFWLLSVSYARGKATISLMSRTPVFLHISTNLTFNFCTNVRAATELSPKKQPFMHTVMKCIIKLKTSTTMWNRSLVKKVSKGKKCQIEKRIITKSLRCQLWPSRRRLKSWDLNFPSCTRLLSSKGLISYLAPEKRLRSGWWLWLRNGGAIFASNVFLAKRSSKVSCERLLHSNYVNAKAYFSFQKKKGQY